MEWLDGQGLGKITVRKLVRKTSLGKVYEYFSKCTKDMKIFVSHINAHQKVTSAEEEYIGVHMHTCAYRKISQKLRILIEQRCEADGQTGTGHLVGQASSQRC